MQNDAPHTHAVAAAVAVAAAAAEHALVPINADDSAAEAIAVAGALARF